MQLVRLDTVFMCSQLRRELIGFELTPIEFDAYLNSCFDYFTNGIEINQVRVVPMCQLMQFSNLGTLIKPDIVELAAITSWFLCYIQHLLLIYEQTVPNLLVNRELNGHLLQVIDDYCVVAVF